MPFEIPEEMIPPELLAQAKAAAEAHHRFAHMVFDNAFQSHEAFLKFAPFLCRCSIWPIPDVLGEHSVCPIHGVAGSWFFIQVTEPSQCPMASEVHIAD